MRALSPSRRSALFVASVIAVLSLLSVSTVSAFVGERYGDGTLGKVTKSTITNAGGVFSAQGGVNHYAIEGKKKAVFTVDVKDGSVDEINYFGSTFCFVPDAETGEPEAVTRSFDGTKSVKDKKTAKVQLRLPNGHLGCDLSLIATVLRPGDGTEQSEIIIRKMVLTATAK